MQRCPDHPRRPRLGRAATTYVIVFDTVRQVAAIAALAITFLVSACSDTGRSNPAAEVKSTPLPSGMSLTCTDRYLSDWSVGPVANGQYVHYVCQNGKVTSWWLDDNQSMESAPPG
jgi:hypothetical protein